jgi:hypothetical protein
MGFLDKAKEKAQTLAGQAKDKFEDVQAKRKADDLLDDLGRILYLQRTARPPADAESEVTRLVAELKVLEAEGVEFVTKSKPADETGHSGHSDVTPS